MTGPIFDLSGKRVFVAGHRGMVGAALMRCLEREPVELLTAGRDSLDLADQRATRDWMMRERPDVVIVAAARVGGIGANAARPADFLVENLLISTNVIEAAHRADVGKLLYLGSSCIYPRMAEQPIREDSLLTGPLEPTNQWYAIAKIAGVKLCQAYREQHGRDFISAMPTNLYGPGDNFHLDNAHVLPALLRKAHEAKLAGRARLPVWGSGRPRREFLHVDDCADALVHLLERYSGTEPVNVGTGEDVSIRELVDMVLATVGHDAEPVFDSSKPDGTPVKRLDVSKLSALGWNARIPLEDGLARTYRWYLDNEDSLRV